MIVVTGATGQLGRLVIAALRERGAAVTAAVRDLDKAADLGVPARLADYDRPETLVAAFEGATRVLLISGTDPNRAEQHRAVVDAAAAAGVELLAYTSVLGAPTSTLGVAPDHVATEAHIRASGVPFAFLRNGWYHENYDQTARRGAETGVITGAAGNGLVASASRADYAEAAAVVLTGDGFANTAHELSGDTAWAMPELADAIAAAAGTEVVYRDLPLAEHRASLVGAGLPEPVADFVSGIDASIARGELAATPGELSALIGRPTTPLRAWVATALKRA
ncbi:NAD(P)H-binding protein [Actinosynnema pretiosum]|uniref:NAD(P)-dependent oxidoreductase n=1 Tax=Actinosynnema pretiosum TaxID=42197 RepID=A0A290Z542_9PSEU|nr:NAD(P)H-binding protein [Actinosynnema pretiosum]ATE54136.1 NAD(P)-dependent oxidoreductase [Actinosynnema pretiosum]